MLSNKELRRMSREALGGDIFCRPWLMALLAVFVASAILSAAGYMTVVGTLFLAGALDYGVTRAFYNQMLKGGEVKFDDLFCAFSEDYWGATALYLLKTLYLFLWSLLIVPGVIKTYSYAMAEYIHQKRRTGTATEFICESRFLMDGHKWDLFLLDLSFLGWYILGSLCLGVGVLWVYPYHRAARVRFFNEVEKEAEYKSAGVSGVNAADEAPSDTLSDTSTLSE